VTNVSLGRPEYHDHLSTPNFKVFESVTASMSIPLLFTPSIINGHYYVDGGILDSCPFSVFPPDENFILYIEGELSDLSTLHGYIGRLITLSLRSIDDTKFKILQHDQRKRKLNMNINMGSSLSVIDFHINVQVKKQLMIKGGQYMEKFLNPQIVVEDYIKIITKILTYNIIKDGWEINNNNNNNNQDNNHDNHG
jgi:predicted acylesterase/phospholipase RssA